jgi:hypothetical protein
VATRKQTVYSPYKGDVRFVKDSFPKDGSRVLLDNRTTSQEPSFACHHVIKDEDPDVLDGFRSERDTELNEQPIGKMLFAESVIHAFFLLMIILSKRRFQ